MMDCYLLRDIRDAAIWAIAGIAILTGAGFGMLWLLYLSGLK